jgi:hypothetical protein
LEINQHWWWNIMKTDLTFSSRQVVFGVEQSPFALGPNQRSLCLFVDSELVSEGAAAQLFDELSSHPALETISSQKDGEDQVIFGDRSDDPLDVLLVEIKTDTGSKYTGIPLTSRWENLAREPDLRNALVLPPGPWTEESYRLRQHLLIEVAKSIDSDVFVTDDHFLLEFGPPASHGLNIVSSPDAVALIGSYLRNRGDFTIQKSGRSTHKLGRGLFYWVLARELLPNGWRWFSAIVASNDQTKVDLIGLGSSALTRVAQALKARDRMHWQFFQPHNNDTADDALFYLDMILLSLSAAFDVVAQVADVALSMGSKPAQHISWNSDSWRRELRKPRNSPALDAAISPTSPHGQVHRLLSLLRNSIHGEALRTVALVDWRRRREHVLVLPRADQAEARYLLSQLGGLDSWGSEELGELGIGVRPGRVPEQLLPRATAALNELMARTPVDRLPGIDPNAEIPPGPPLDNDHIWGEDTRRRVRLLSGL